ncbi:MAG: glycosyltransferase family 4 protein [Actinobacteria bacterium]|nr:glycosyltransferase family 4 protein [Actinomycetota bacterium]MBV8599133.1 glycosyltransferase family 4 protein [Actinomycetota bacterium]
MRKLVFITQVVDPDDPNLGATTAKIAALAARVDEMVVICDRGREDVLPENCRMRVFGAPSRVQRLARFVRAVSAEMPAPVVAHMIALYALVAAPIVRPRRVPLILWYTHWKRHLLLRLATAVSTDVVSVDRHSFPLHSRKLHEIGHGIDLSEFPCQPTTSNGVLRLVALGRYSPAKNLEELIEGVRIARERGVDARIDLYGTTGAPQNEEYKRRLEGLANDFVGVRGAVPRTEVPSIYAGADVVASDFDSPDKVVLEGCASCRPVLASDESFHTLLEGIEPPLAFVRGRPEMLADRIAALAALGDEERHAIGRTLRERVAARHSVDTWADAVVELASA